MEVKTCSFCASFAISSRKEKNDSGKLEAIEISSNKAFEYWLKSNFFIFLSEIKLFHPEENSGASDEF